MVSVFRGWIPNVTARMSFWSIGRSAHPSNCASANQADAISRYVICHQRRNLLDTLLPRIAIRFLTNWDGDFRFILSSNTVPHDDEILEKIEGKIFILSEKESWTEDIQSTVANVQNKLRSYNKNSGCLESFICDDKEKMEIALARCCLFSARVQILRSGICLISLTKATVEKVEKTQSNPNVWKEGIANQVFFFLKDIMHTHQHHDSNTDAILCVYPKSKDWIRETLYSLYRRVISYKKAKSVKELYQSQGVLAYARCFKGIIAQRAPKAAEGEINSHSPLPHYDDESIAASITSSKDLIDWEANEKFSSNERMQGLVIAVVGLILSFVSLLSLTGEKINLEEGSSLLEIGGIIVNNPFAIFVLALALYGLIRFRAALRFAGRIPGSNFILRIVQPIPQKTAVALLLALAVGIIYFFARMLVTVFD